MTGRIATLGDQSMSRRNLLQALGIGAGAISLAACAPSGGSTKVAAAPSATAAAKAENFSFAAWSLSEGAGKPVIEGQLNAFGKSKGVTVAPVSYPFNEYLNQMTLQVRGGQFNGAAQIDIAWLGTLAALGKLQDLSGLAKGRGYSPPALKAGQFNGQQYGLPWTMGAIGLVANSDILSRIGVDKLPTDVKEFEAVLRELKALGDGTIPYAASTKVAQLKDFQVWMQTFGCSLIEKGKVTIGDDASIEAITWYKRLHDDGLIAPDVDRFDARSLFSQGKAAMYDDAPVGRAAIIKDSPDKDLAAKLMPAARPVLSAGDDPRALAWGHTVVVVNGAGAGTAGEFAQWLTSDEKVVVDYFTALGLPPTTKAGLASAAVKADTFITAFGERITATATPSPFWIYPQYGQIDTVIAEKVQAVLIGRTDPATAMKEAGKATQALIG